jgi:hypothetical protein
MRQTTDYFLIFESPNKDGATLLERIGYKTKSKLGEIEKKTTDSN